MDARGKYWVRNCLSESGGSIVSMVQPAKSVVGHDPPGSARWPSVVRRSLPQSEMRLILVAIADLFRKQSFQKPLVHRDRMIEQILPTALNPTLSDAVLPRALKRTPEGSDPQRSNRPGEPQGRTCHLGHTTGIGETNRKETLRGAAGSPIGSWDASSR